VRHPNVSAATGSAGLGIRPGRLPDQSDHSWPRRM